MDKGALCEGCKPSFFEPMLIKTHEASRCPTLTKPQQDDIHAVTSCDRLGALRQWSWDEF